MQVGHSWVHSLSTSTAATSLCPVHSLLTARSSPQLVLGEGLWGPPAHLHASWTCKQAPSPTEKLKALGLALLCGVRMSCTQKQPGLLVNTQHHTDSNAILNPWVPNTSEEQATFQISSLLTKFMGVYKLFSQELLKVLISNSLLEIKSPDLCECVCVCRCGWRLLDLQSELCDPGKYRDSWGSALALVEGVYAKVIQETSPGPAIWKYQSNAGRTDWISCMALLINALLMPKSLMWCVKQEYFNYNRAISGSVTHDCVKGALAV